MVALIVLAHCLFADTLLIVGLSDRFLRNSDVIQQLRLRYTIDYQHYIGGFQSTIACKKHFDIERIHQFKVPTIRLP